MVNRAMGRPNVEIIVLRIDGVMQNLRAPGNNWCSRCAMYVAKVLEELLFVNLIEGIGGELSSLEYSLRRITARVWPDEFGLTTHSGAR